MSQSAPRTLSPFRRVAQRFVQLPFARTSATCNPGILSLLSDLLWTPLHDLHREFAWNQVNQMGLSIFQGITGYTVTEILPSRREQENALNVSH